MIFIRFIVITSLTTLVSCTYFPRPEVLNSRDRVYLSAKSIPPLKIPPGTDSRAFNNAFPVSNKVYPEAQKNVDLTPPGLNQ
jgi:uncharacterized lipoprotein